jgi:hypothetical protein
VGPTSVTASTIMADRSATCYAKIKRFFSSLFSEQSVPSAFQKKKVFLLYYTPAKHNWNFYNPFFMFHLIRLGLLECSGNEDDDAGNGEHGRFYDTPQALTLRDDSLVFRAREASTNLELAAAPENLRSCLFRSTGRSQ